MRNLTSMIFILAANLAFSQNPERGYFGAYETLEMAMNNFKNFAGEFGYRFNQKNQMRMTIMEVKLTERHLSSGWEAGAVDGKDVEGYFRGYEMHYDRFISKQLTMAGGTPSHLSVFRPAEHTNYTKKGFSRFSCVGGH